MKKIITLFVLASCFAAHAEFGVSAGATFKTKANFKTSAKAYGFRNNPGPASAETDHFYDDGYNRVDSSGNFNNETTYWGYQNASQDHGGSLTMSSSRTLINSQSFSSDSDDVLPALELYWQNDFTTNQVWNIGIRAALRWQQVEIDSHEVFRTETETVSDSYSYTGVLPGEGFNGSYGGPNFLLGDIPSRSISSSPGASYVSSRELDADIFAFDLGPTLSVDLTEKLRLTASIGGTAAWIESDFTYSDGPWGAGSDSESEWLFGAYAGADLSYMIGEHWGLFGGAAYTRLEDFEQGVNGRSAELQFDDSYTVRVGLFFR